MADVTFTFGGDATSLTNALKGIKEELAATKNSVAGLTSQFASAYIAVQGAVAAIKTAFSAVSNIPSQAARMEDLTTILGTLMGDTEQAASLISDLWRDAANGAVSLEDMVAAAKPLATVFSDNKSIIEWTNRFANISAGSGMAADSLSKLYSRIVTLGKADSRGIDTLAKQGIPIYQELSEVLGVTAAEVQQLAKKGEISSAQYSAAIRKMTDEGGRYYQQSSLLSNTAKGSWDTLVENVNRAAAALGQPINEAITPILQKMGAAVQNSLPAVSDFARNLVSSFSSIADTMAPLVSGIGSVVSAMGGMKTVVASVVAGLLLFSGNANTAAVSTVSLQARVASLINTMRGLSMASFGNAFKSAMSGLSGIFTSTLASMRGVWAATWATMAAVTRGAMLAVKTAIVSTGIGLIIVGIGEALGALYNWFMGSSEAAKEAARATQEFERSLAGMEKQASKVKTEEQYNSFMEGLQDRIDDLKGERDMAALDEDEDKVALLEEQISILNEEYARYSDTLPKQVAAAQAEERRAEALRKQKEEAAELEKELEAARKKMADLVEKQHEHQREAFLSGLDDKDMEIDYRLRDVGHTSIEELAKEMQSLEKRQGMLKQEDVARYEKLAAVYNKVLDIQREQTKEAAKTAEEERKRNEEAEKKRQEIANAQQEYDMKVKILQAEIAGNEKKLQQLKHQQRVAELTAEYQRQGIADAEAAANRMADLERKAEAAKKKSEAIGKDSARGRENATRISSSLASVGGGGRSILIGGPLVTEGKKHTKLLEQIRTETAKKPTVQVSGNVEAVIGR